MTREVLFLSFLNFKKYKPNQRSRIVIKIIIKSNISTRSLPLQHPPVIEEHLLSASNCICSIYIYME